MFLLRQREHWLCVKRMRHLEPVAAGLRHFFSELTKKHSKKRRTLCAGRARSANLQDICGPPTSNPVGAVTLGIRRRISIVGQFVVVFRKNTTQSGDTKRPLAGKNKETVWGIGSRLITRGFLSNATHRLCILAGPQIMCLWWALLIGFTARAGTGLKVKEGEDC